MNKIIELNAEQIMNEILAAGMEIHFVPHVNEEDDREELRDMIVCQIVKDGLILEQSIPRWSMEEAFKMVLFERLKL